MKTIISTVKRTVFVIFGSFMTAIGINIFITPHKLLSGGIAGIGIILQYLTGISSGYIVLALNIPIFIVGIKEIDKDFIIYSILGTGALSLFLIITKDIGKSFMVNDILLSCIYGGVINGIGVGTVLKCRGSQGGTDIISVIIKKYTGQNIGTLSLIMNIVVVLAGSIMGGYNIALYTLISMYISSVVLDRVIEGFDRKKLLFIVTDREQEVADAIMEKIGRGATYFYGQGAYTGKERHVIYCTISSNQLPRAKKIISDIDPKSFISIVDAAEVQGKGFRHPAL